MLDSRSFNIAWVQNIWFYDHLFFKVHSILIWLSFYILYVCVCHGCFYACMSAYIKFNVRVSVCVSWSIYTRLYLWFKTHVRMRDRLARLLSWTRRWTLKTARPWHVQGWGRRVQWWKESGRLSLLEVLFHNHCPFSWFSFFPLPLLFIWRKRGRVEEIRMGARERETKGERGELESDMEEK